MRNSRSNRGVSTILGTLLFVAIIFSAIIPMQLTMYQADVIYAQKAWEVKRLDDERSREEVLVYPVPDLAATHINVTLINNCETSVDILRVWMNNTLTNITTTIPTLENTILGPFPINPGSDASFDVRVATGRGNTFSAETGVLYYQNGEWLTDTLGFRLIFPSRPGKSARTNNWLNELMVTIEDSEGDEVYINSTMYWAISASENFFELDSADSYTVKVYIWCKAPPWPKHWEKIYDSEHAITWPIGDPVIELKYRIDGNVLVLD